MHEHILFESNVTTENQTTQKQKEAPLFPFWIEDRGLSFFLAFLVLVTIFVPMITLSRYGRIGLGLIFALMLFSGAVATIHKRVLMYFIIALTIVEFTADLMVEFNPSFGHPSWDTALTSDREMRPGRTVIHFGECELGQT